MKSYNETVSNVFRRIEEYEAAKKQKRKIIEKTGAGLCCICLIAVIGMSVHHTTTATIRKEQANITKNSTASSDYSQSISQTNAYNDTTVSENQNLIDEPAVNGFFIPINPNGQQNESVIQPKKVIRYYSCSDANDRYVLPKNGEITLTKPLNMAIAEYGDSVLYEVEIYIVENQCDIDGAKWTQEYERISKILNNGELGLSTFKNSDGQIIYTLLGAVSKSTLDNFPVSDKYGYYITLSGNANSECTAQEPNIVVFNGIASNEK